MGGGIAALETSLQPTQPILSLRDRDGSPLDPPRRVRAQAREAARRIHELERELQRLHDERGPSPPDHS